MRPKVKADLQASADDRAKVREETAAAQERLTHLLEESRNRRKRENRERRFLERRHASS